VIEAVAPRQSSPSTGKRSARPAGKPGDSFVKGAFARSLKCHSCVNTEVPPYAFFEAWRNLSVRCGQGKTKPRGGRRLPPAGRPRAQVQERAGRITLFSSSAMSSDRLFLDQVGRHQSLSPLHRRTQNNTHPTEAQAKGDISTLLGGRHFYFALTMSSRSFDSGQKL
jgi:hypothetical protein